MDAFDVPHSSGTQAPTLRVPPDACDSHLHIYDPRFPSVGDPGRGLPNATAGDYRKLQARLGTRRAVVVTPAVYGTDNRATLDAIAQLGPASTRGVAVVHPDVDDATLLALQAGGVRGIRFTLFDPSTAVTRFDMVEPLSKRAAALGWHVQLHWRADQIVEHEALLNRLPSTLVFDHLARLPHPAGPLHPAFDIVARLLDHGRTWVKVSGPYLDDPAVVVDDSRARVVAALLARAPERLVWGSDWPHPTEKTVKPDDAALLDRFGTWVADAGQRQRILVDNAAGLYGF